MNSTDNDLRIIEAILFASSQPVSEIDLKEKIVNKNNLKNYLEELKEFYQNRGINLLKTGNKWSFITSADIKNKLTIFKTQKRKLSRAAIETLAIIAYQQPITRSEIENIRGVQMGIGSIDHLMELGWIKPSGKKNIPGTPSLWITTEVFLEHFGISNITDLPDKKELEASGFLDKRAAIATITDIANNEIDLNLNKIDDEEEENIDEFLNNKI